MLKPFFFILSNIWESSKKFAIIQLILLIAIALLPLLSFVLIKNIIDLLATHGGTDFSVFKTTLIVLAAILIINSIAQNMSSFIGEMQEQLITNYFSSKIQAHSVTLDVSYYDNPDFHKTLHRAQEEAAFRPTMILQGVVGLVESSFTVASVGVLLFYQHWAIVLVLLFTAVPAVFVKIHYSRKLFEIQDKNFSIDIKSWYLNWVLTKPSFAKEVRIFNFGKQLRERFKDLRTQLYKARYFVHWHLAISSSIVNIVESIAFLTALSYTIYLASIGTVSIGALVMYYQIFQKGQSSLQVFLRSLVKLYHNQQFIEYIYNFLHIKSNMSRSEPHAAPPPYIEQVSIKNLGFSYPNTEKPALKNVNVTMERGQVIALVGENGSGKTTFIKLLCRLYDINKGQILVNGVNIKQYDIGEWRQRITVIFQDFMRYEFSASDNIAISDVHKPLDHDAIKSATEKTTADEFISYLPKGIDTKLGKEYEDGAELSGGQWQKIALARAFYKDADIIVLDEPTSAIDPLSEHEIFSQLKDMAQGKILILITHRLYNLKMADSILVFDKGELLETGSHDELIEQEGKYFQMFEKQMV
jgi:ATP-binding cassette, subfamily B, bacterial